jgi:hypothetical protein
MVGWSGLLGNRQLLTRSGLPVPAHGPKGGAGPSAVPARPSPAQRVNSTSAAGGIICFSLVEFRSLLPHPFPPSLPSSRAPAPRRSRYLSYHRSLSRLLPASGRRIARSPRRDAIAATSRGAANRGVPSFVPGFAALRGGDRLPVGVCFLEAILLFR